MMARRAIRPEDRSEGNMIDLAPFEALVPLDHGLCVVVTRRADGSPHSTVVNAGVLVHPFEANRVVAFVARGDAAKLRHLRRDPTVAVTIRAGWQWSTVEGRAEMLGPDDPHPDLDPEGLRLLLRSVFTAAGGTHDDWPTYDEVMRAERRTAVLVQPVRAFGVPR
jgi:PPOX class probable F420-dependent enzyme